MTDRDPNIFRVGDVVRVANIVGPRMLVTRIVPDDGLEPDRTVETEWFDRRMELCTAAFDPRHLAKASPWLERPPRSAMPEAGDEMES